MVDSPPDVIDQDVKNPEQNDWISKLRDSISSEIGITAALFFLLLVLNILPILAVISGSFTAEGVRLVTEPSLANWIELAQSERDVIAHTLVFTVGTSVLTTSLAVVIGWVLARTNTPLRNVYYYLLLSVFFIPPVIYEDAWIRLLTTNGVYPTLLGLDSLPVHTLSGMIMIQSIRILPLGILLLMPLYTQIGQSLEDASRLAGANIFQTIYKITFRLLKPGILSVLLFTSIITLGSFRVPMIIGLPGNVSVIATEVFIKTNQNPVDFGIAFAQGAVLIFLAIPLLFLYKKYLGKTNQYATVSGEDSTKIRTDLGRWKYVISGMMAFFILMIVIGPIAVMLYASVLPYYMHPHDLGLSTFLAQASIDPYVSVLQNQNAIDALVNSLTVAITGSTLVCVFVVLISWLVQKTNIPYRNVIDYMAFIPIGIPSVALALGVAFIYLEILVIGVYGTLLIYIVAFFTRSTPVNLRIVDPAVIQINKSMLESSRVSGASLLRTIRSILSPLIVSSLQIAWITSVAYMTIEMAIVMLLRTPNTEMVASILYQMNTSAASISEAYAYGVIVTLILLSIAILSAHLSNKIY